MVRVETDHLEDLYHKIDDKDLTIINVSFRITAIREVQCNKIVHNMVAHINHTFKGTKETHTEAKARVGVLSISEDEPTAGRIFRIMLAPININTTHMISNQNSMAHHVVCVEDLIIPQALLCHDLKEILRVPNFYYICQMCYLQLGLRSSGFVHD